jgi:transcriptional regulator GlxA family with amidase domain
VRRAIAFIEENAHRDITAADIAAACPTTLRAVQLAFQRHLDTTPMAYLRRARLQNAHRDLLAAGPERTTVTAVAYRWGFNGASRFAAAYRRAYGTTPAKPCAVANPLAQSVATADCQQRPQHDWPAGARSRGGARDG